MSIAGRPLLLTLHARALHLLDAQPDLRLRQLAEELDVTPRTAHRLVDELEDLGLLQRTRVGRRNRYRVVSLPWLRAAVEHDRRLRAARRDDRSDRPPAGFEGFDDLDDLEDVGGRDDFDGREDFDDVA